MHKLFWIIGILVTAGLAMGLPYALRQRPVVGNEVPTPTASPQAIPQPIPQAADSAVESKPAPIESKAAAVAPASVEVAIQNFSFGPAELTVPKGTTVVWTNKDSAGHTVTGDAGGPASALLNQGGEYRFTFDTPGTFSYHCAPHPFMKATIRVSE